MKRCLVLLLVALVGASSQFDSNANDYALENVEGVPLKKTLVFSTGRIEDVQRENLPKANVVIGVISSPSHFDQRQAVRSTWAQMQSLTDPKLNGMSLEQKEQMVVRFVIGQQTDKATEAALAKEAARFHDIVRVPVDEGWFNLTLKTGEFMKWAVTNYAFDWAFKCDDDSFVRPDLLLKELATHKPTKTYIGKIWTGTPVDRRVDSTTPFKEYSPFAAGAGYGLTYDLAHYIARSLDSLYKWPMEDVAVGMWLSSLDVTIIDHKNFHSLPEGCDKDMIVQNPAPPQVMRDTFHNAVVGVPCHAKPDPFRSETKNVPDHVLLELGIPKTKKELVDSMQTLVAVPEDESDDDLDSKDVGGMGVDTMNNNAASAALVMDMNSQSNHMVLEN